MNTESLLGWLVQLGVPAELVSIGAEADHTWCLLREEAEGGPAWEVFWREQGNRYDWARFSSEQVACFYLFGRLTWTQALRGAIGPADPERPAAPAVSHEPATPPHGTPAP
ncbi:hypothetical protein ACL03H_17705 [Saccharopolyspora sp. MS10]|uniref:hypothetical protein n=1 Tax=Saccharopolyspora sp. MS10 TaxID=3385973 RepID=UPI0039A11DCF